jgi:HSP20 family molecular chaperone IbpA
MSRGHFNSPHLLGFDQIERVLERVSKTAGDAYPPYNIEQIGEDILRITLAVAGFAKEDLDVTVEDSQLVISGVQADEGERQFIHRGIAARRFRRAFVLADGIEITGASLQNGLLNIDLARPRPAVSVKRIEIDAGEEGAIDANEPRTIKLASHKGE